MPLNESLITIENLIATSPSGNLTAVPTKVEKTGTDTWDYYFEPDRREAGEWVVTLNSEGFSVSKSTELGKIHVSPGTVNLVSINWGSIEKFGTDLDSAIADIATLMAKVESDPVATQQVEVLDAKVSGLITVVNELPTNATLDPIKTSVTELQTKYQALDTEKASATSVQTANEAIEAVSKALKELASLPPDVSQAELDVAIKKAEDADKVATDAIAAVKKSAEDSATSLVTAIADITKLKTDLAAIKKTADAAGTKTSVDANKSAIDALDARLDVLEVINNDLYQVSGSPFIAGVALGLRTLVYIGTDGKVYPADNTDVTKVAIGVTDGAVAAGASVKVFSTGSKFSSIGISGISSGTKAYLGAAGGFTLSTTGVNRVVQIVAIFRGNTFWFDFTDPGYLVVAE